MRAGEGPDAIEDSFDIDDYTRWRLLEGLDDIGITLVPRGRHRGVRGDAAELEARHLCSGVSSRPESPRTGIRLRDFGRRRSRAESSSAPRYSAKTPRTWRVIVATRHEYLACVEESRATARPHGSLEGKLVNKSQLIDALAARYEGNRKAARARAGVRPRHDHPRGGQGREGRDHRLRVVREAGPRGPLGAQPADRRADQGQEDGGAEVHRRRGPEERRLRRQEAAEADVIATAADRAPRPRRPRRPRRRRRSPAPRRPPAKKAAPAKKAGDEDRAKKAPAKKTAAKKATGQEDRRQEGGSGQEDAGQEDGGQEVARRRRRPRRPPAKKATAAKKAAGQEGRRPKKAPAKKDRQEVLTHQSSEGGSPRRRPALSAFRQSAGARPRRRCARRRPSPTAAARSAAVVDVAPQPRRGRPAIAPGAAVHGAAPRSARPKRGLERVVRRGVERGPDRRRVGDEPRPAGSLRPARRRGRRPQRRQVGAQRDRRRGRASVARPPPRPSARLPLRSPVTPSGMAAQPRAASARGEAARRR